MLQELGRGGERAHELACFVTNTSYDSEKGELRNHIFIHLSLEGELSHGESALLLLLTKSLLSSLRSQERRIANLLLSQSAAHGTGGLGTQIGGQVLGLSVVLLELRNEPRKRRTYSSSLLLAEHSQGASNVLAHHLNLGEFRGSSSGHLRHTQLPLSTESDELPERVPSCSSRFRRAVHRDSSGGVRRPSLWLHREFASRKGRTHFSNIPITISWALQVKGKKRTPWVLCVGVYCSRKGLVICYPLHSISHGCFFLSVAQPCRQGKECAWWV